MQVWEKGNRYRGKGVSGQFAIKEIPNQNRTRYVEGMIECVLGPMLGQRIRYRGYINTRENAKTTADELRAMGLRATKWGDFSGIGSKECDFAAMADDASDGSGKQYFRATFVREPFGITDKHNVDVGDLDDINADLGDLLAAPASTPPARNGARQTPVEPSNKQEAWERDADYVHDAAEGG